MHAFLNTALKAARQASQVIVRAFDQPGGIDSEKKSSHDLISQMDHQAEQILIDTILYHYPDHAILAEESGLQGEDNGHLWIIDPIDGSNNFIHGIPHFSISMAYQYQGKTTHALIYDPIQQETFSASAGCGAMLNGKRIRVAEKKELDDAIIATALPFRQRDRLAEYYQQLQQVFDHCADIRRTGSAALDLAYVAAGRFDGYWELELKSWDIAAGLLLIKEAGGLVSNLKGIEISSIDQISQEKSFDIATGNPKIFKGLIKHLNQSNK